jgi:ubiquinone/menaquinone biosynthesis C-methylase UbiE
MYKTKCEVGTMSSHNKVWHLTDETERRKWQDPEAILKEIRLRPGQVFMDLGCGGGFFTFPAVRLVGTTGRVYGVDINEDFIEQMRQKASAEGINNLDLKVGTAEDTLFCHSCADVIFFGIVLHDFQTPEKVLQNAREMLKPEGRLVDLDWKKKAMSFGPPVSVRFDEETASKLINDAGFKIESIKDSGQYHYLIIARPL